jgi:hypothetical protein
MNPAPHAPDQPRVPDTMDLVAQTRSLRRKLTFWRRLAWLVLGAGAIFVAVLWNRGESHRRLCGAALDHYVKLADKSKLAGQRPEILEQQWQIMEQASTSNPTTHYNLIVKNWQVTPKPGEVLDLAVCREPHFTLLSQMRHVLRRDVSGPSIEWITDEQAAAIVAEAQRDDKPL